MTLNDLNKYEVKTREPISANILGLKVLSMPPPSSRGVSMVLALNILTQYTVPSGLSGSLGTHRVIESLKHAFTVRMNLSDPEFVNVSKFVADMISPEFSKKLKKTLNDNMTFGPIHYGGAKFMIMARAIYPLFMIIARAIYPLLIKGKKCSSKLTHCTSKKVS
ncbi:hypothetical protein F3Y22_tig00110332pilonHSYRG00961 [Hibiscus syriacus]|uniref:Uncharacterized protein n=1 Tax=Hibiscus syriacus TaxID=106335 RepID=A0A6A3AWI7_HIBSY|nr:hypothetical protein F3Y22_tig00110332pilonHSYRG00961 [Hibiscus syriacus]